MTETLGTIIGILRAKKGETQQQLADKIGVSREYVKAWEADLRAVRSNHLISLAKHFGVSCDYLLGLTDIKSPDPTLQAAVEYTGLSEKAIEGLARCNSFQIKALNKLFSSTAFAGVEISLCILNELLEKLEQELNEAPLIESNELDMKTFNSLPSIFKDARLYRFETIETITKAIDVALGFPPLEQRFNNYMNENDEGGAEHDEQK